MKGSVLKKALRFYFITDDAAPRLTAVEQVRIALAAGATIVQYRNKAFTITHFEEVAAIAELCRTTKVPFIVNDHVLLAKAVRADGVHLGQEDASPRLARKIVGPKALVGLSVHNLEELAASDLAVCDYIGTGPAYPTRTKTDTHAVQGLDGLRAVAEASSLPMVAIGGITAGNAAACFDQGASGVAVISAISRADNPFEKALALGRVCGCPPRHVLS